MNALNMPLSRFLNATLSICWRLLVSSTDITCTIIALYDENWILSNHAMPMVSPRIYPLRQKKIEDLNGRLTLKILKQTMSFLLSL